MATDAYSRLIRLREIAADLPLVIRRDGSTGRITVTWDSDDDGGDPLFSGPEAHARVYLAGFARGYINQPAESK